MQHPGRVGDATANVFGLVNLTSRVQPRSHAGANAFADGCNANASGCASRNAASGEGSSGNSKVAHLLAKDGLSGFANSGLGRTRHDICPGCRRSLAAKTESQRPRLARSKLQYCPSAKSFCCARCLDRSCAAKGGDDGANLKALLGHLVEANGQPGTAAVLRLLVLKESEQSVVVLSRCGAVFDGPHRPKQLGNIDRHLCVAHKRDHVGDALFARAPRHCSPEAKSGVFRRLARGIHEPKPLPLANIEVDAGRVTGLHHDPSGLTGARSSGLLPVSDNSGPCLLPSRYLQLPLGVIFVNESFFANNLIAVEQLAAVRPAKDFVVVSHQMLRLSWLMMRSRFLASEILLRTRALLSPRFSSC